jgi:hypothetical protein
VVKTSCLEEPSHFGRSYFVEVVDYRFGTGVTAAANNTTFMKLFTSLNNVISQLFIKINTIKGHQQIQKRIVAYNNCLLLVFLIIGSV